jgi:APA family basic amino acid/polyamine antiporter
MTGPASGGARPHQSLTIVDGAAFLIGIIIGIGIFKVPSLVAMNVDSEAGFIGLWILGGFVTLIGALCYAELGSSHPSAGGEYHYLSRAFGHPVGVMFAWARGTVIQTGAIAAVGFVYGDYMSVLIPLGPYSSAIHAGIAILAITLLNISGLRPTMKAQIVLTTLEVLAIVTVIAVGFYADPAPRTEVPVLNQPMAAAGLAMVFVLLTYGGWNEAAYLSGEMKDVRRNLVRSLLIATVTVTVLYTVINFAYLNAFGLAGLRKADVVAADLMRTVAGDKGAVMLSVIIIICALSTLNATIFTGARVYYALGRDLAALKLLGHWVPDSHKPSNALMVQCAIALALIVLGGFARDGFQTMVEYTAPVFWFFLLLVGISVFVLRGRTPEHKDVFRVPLYPLPPILFCATCLWLLYSSLAYTGVGALVGVAVLLVGTPLLFLARGTPEPAE